MIYQSVGVSARAGTVPSGRGRKKDGAAGLCRATRPVAAQCAAGGVDGPGQLPIDLYKGEVAARQRSRVGGRHRTRAGGVEMYLPRYAAEYTWYSVPSYISHCPRVPSQGPYVGTSPSPGRSFSRRIRIHHEAPDRQQTSPSSRQRGQPPPVEGAASRRSRCP